ncbi:hypothetical protein O1L60_21520 [Streptomyces diastatochromogenes]|nr:hypothetical protein [Streptomyces diastatochromogenes]
MTRAGSEQALAVYQELRARPGTSFDEAADRLGLSADERDRCRSELASLGLTAPADPESTETPRTPPGRGARLPVVVDPDVALLRLLRRERDRLQDRLAATSRAHTALEALAGPFLHAGAAPRPRSRWRSSATRSGCCAS